VLAVGGDGQFEHLREILEKTLRELPDARRGKNTVYDMRDGGMAAFAVFFMQSPSFLAQQQLMQTRHGFNNARSMFGIERIPTDNLIRALLDGVPATAWWETFEGALAHGRQEGVVEGYRTPLGHLLAAIDGTQYFRSTRIHCQQCSWTDRGDSPREYSHMVVAAAIVSPDKPQVLPLIPEFVRQAEGAEIQDCELVAGRRWFAKHGPRYRDLALTILGDDKYANHPTCTGIMAEGMHFILSCKPSSHPGLYTALEVDRKGGFVQRLQRTAWTGRRHLVYDYQFCNELPLREEKEALEVNWMQLTITVEETGEQEYHNSYITDFTISAENVEALVQEGRSRWNIENAHNNTLKTKGYHFEHNFGHGEKHLSETLLSLNLLAFLFHNLLESLHEQYRQTRALLKRRTRFYDDIRTLCSYYCYASMDVLLRCMLESLRDGPGPPPDPQQIIR
jgi:hypothetical protein